MGHYRAYGAFYQRYWSRLFAVTRADLDLLCAAIATRADEAGRASDLTNLVRVVVASRLNQGPRLDSAAAPDTKVADPVVRKWDAAASWAAGDRAIFVVPDLDRIRGFAPRLGDVMQVGSDHALVRIDGRSTPQVYAIGPAAPKATVVAGQTGPSAESLMTAQSESDDVGSCIDDVLWRFGDVVVGRLLGAIKADSRFVELDGLWFLRELAKRPHDQELATAASVLFELEVPSLTLDGLLARVNPKAQVSAPERFGWALALEERPDTFARVSTMPLRWMLAGPPPVRLIARYAAYDPESYVVLCTPGDTLSAEAARQLWDCGLLYAAVGMGDAPPEPLPAQRPASVPATTTAHRRPTKLPWWRRLLLSRR
jgi:hypothetical protein